MEDIAVVQSYYMYKKKEQVVFVICSILFILGATRDDQKI